MSAFLCSAKHLSVIANNLKSYGIVTSAAVAFAMLREQNVRSLQERYGEDAADEKATARKYKLDLTADEGGDFENVAKLLHSYEYQSCETEDWEQCAARKACDALALALLDEYRILSGRDVWELEQIEGYEDAPWSI